MTELSQHWLATTERVLRALEWRVHRRLVLLAKASSEPREGGEDYEFEVGEGGPAADVNLITNSLSSENAAKAGESGHRALHIFIRDHDANVVGGLIGATYWQWLVIDSVWVDAKLRGQGFGTRLLRMAHEEAVKRGCQQAFLDTFSFQRAVGLYKAEGYYTFGVLDAFPPGHKRFFMRKDLPAAATAEKEYAATIEVSEHKPFTEINR